MKEIIIYTFLISILFAGKTHASEFDSEQFWQAPMGKLVLTAEAGGTYFVDDGTTVNGTLPVSNQITGQIYRPGVTAEFGILRSPVGDYSISTGAFFKIQNEDNGLNDPNGFEDIAVTLKGRWLVATYNYSWHYGVRVFLSLANRRIDQAGDLNSFSGGTGIEPYFGFQYLFPRSTVGLELSFRQRSDRKVTLEDNLLQTSEEASFSGGNQFAVTLFTEVPFRRFLLGGNLKFSQQAKETFTKSNGNKTDNDNFSNLTAGIYGSFDLTDNLVLVPRVEQKFLLNSELNDKQIDTFSFTTLLLQFRLTI